MARFLIMLALACCYRNRQHLGDECDHTCVAPAECQSVVSVNESVSRECWLPCGEHGECPEGLHCSDADDGPTHVCDR